jgi:hypothetical protein
MSNAHEVHARYQTAIETHCEACRIDPQQWHQANAELAELRRQLFPRAESGNPSCQYALATIAWLGLCCESEEEFMAGHATAVEEATRWWVAAATKGYWPALDNLVTSGIGPEAERAREASQLLERARPDLEGTSHGMPVYGLEFFQELSKNLYGHTLE